MIRRAILLSVLATVCAGLLIFLGIPAERVAQIEKGSIAGTVTDSAGVALKDAQVSLESQDVKVVTDQQGRFSLRNLVPGSYILRVTSAGFSTWTKTVDIGANGAIRFNAQLREELHDPSLLLTAAQAK